MKTVHLPTGLGAYIPALLVFLSGCGLDGGIEPLRSAIEGEIEFVGHWPDSLVEVRVVAYEDYPPANFTDLAAWSDPLPVGEAAVEYRVALPPGEYALVALAGRYAGTGWTPLVQYDADDVAGPDTVRLPNRKSIVQGVNFTVTFAGRGSGITGRITFANAWNDTVSSIRVGALFARMTDPKVLPVTDLFTELNFRSRVFDKDDTSYVYRIELPPNTYRTVGVSWMGYKAGGAPESWEDIGDLFKLFSRPVLGVYNQDGSLVPDSVVVETDTWINDVDIVVDFNRTKL